MIDLNVPVNDGGTYRHTLRWSPKGEFSKYNENSTLWLTEAHAMLRDLLPDDECTFFRWDESVDLQVFRWCPNFHQEKREFLSPNITFLPPSSSKIIFGARVCFAAKFPGQWQSKTSTIHYLEEHKVHIKNISNSTTSSSKIVTAGYIFFKAAHTTHQTRFLQSLRQLLPKETPFFDILLFHRTPTEQKINHFFSASAGKTTYHDLLRLYPQLS